MVLELQSDLFAPKFSIEKVEVQRREYCDPFYAAHEERLLTIGDGRLEWDEKRWNHKDFSAVLLDVEVYWNFCVICFKRVSDGTRLAFEMSNRCPLNKEGVRWVLDKNLTVSWNGFTYDLPIIFMALAGADTYKLKEVSNEIINGGHKSWMIEQRFGIKIPRLNHIDLIEPTPSLRQSLKMLNGRLHGRYIVDLPYHEDATLTPFQMNYATLYCHNDLDSTELVFNAMAEPIKLREALGKQYGLELRSKSDAQVGEAIVRKRVETALGCRLQKSNPENKSFKYEPPNFLKFQDRRLVTLLDKLREATFYSNVASEKINMPSFLENFQITFGDSTYSMGIGGLHSKEEHRSVFSTEEYAILDVDVASQYPNIIMKLGLYPELVGPAFLDIYGELIKERLAAKAAGNKVAADGGRVATNGVYGKLGNQYSVLYGPHLMIATTLTGQLSILMLIERAEAIGVSVISANTDGLVFYCKRTKEDELRQILRQWEQETGLVLEETRYKALYNSSVNVYIAIREDGKIKRKGYISDPWRENDIRVQLMKNPHMTICAEAVVQFITKGVAIEDTIKGCNDIRSFLTIVRVSTGGVWRGHHLGRAVRYYWSLDGSPIYYAKGKQTKNGPTRPAKVSNTDGARPLPELLDELPDDIDYLRYCQEAVKLAIDIGVKTFT